MMTAFLPWPTSTYGDSRVNIKLRTIREINKSNSQFAQQIRVECRLVVGDDSN